MARGSSADMLCGERVALDHACPQFWRGGFYRVRRGDEPPKVVVVVVVVVVKAPQTCPAVKQVLGSDRGENPLCTRSGHRTGLLVSHLNAR
jgi:hypothetical protein